MSLNLVGFENKAREAVMAFWGNRAAARKKQIETGEIDQGERSSVTAGNNMDGFISLICDVIEANGLSSAEILYKRTTVTLPGFYRPTKQWDILVIYKEELIAAIELKSQVGSFGNNFNNRTEEAIGTAVDLWEAYREGAFGTQPQPFVGWLMMAEDAPGSRRPVKDKSPHFPVHRAFENASYLKRYDILCQHLVMKQLYTSAAIIASHQDAIYTGEYCELSGMTDLRTFLASLASHVALAASRLGPRF